MTKHKAYTAMLMLEEFTVVEIAKVAGSTSDAVRKLIQRNPSLFETLGNQGRQGSGRPQIRYALSEAGRKEAQAYLTLPELPPSEFRNPGSLSRVSTWLAKRNQKSAANLIGVSSQLSAQEWAGWIVEEFRTNSSSNAIDNVNKCLAALESGAPQCAEGLALALETTWDCQEQIGATKFLLKALTQRKTPTAKKIALRVVHYEADDSNSFDAVELEKLRVLSLRILRRFDLGTAERRRLQESCRKHSFNVKCEAAETICTIASRLQYGPLTLLAEDGMGPDETERAFGIATRMCRRFGGLSAIKRAIQKLDVSSHGLSQLLRTKLVERAGLLLGDLDSDTDNPDYTVLALSAGASAGIVTPAEMVSVLQKISSRCPPQTAQFLFEVEGFEVQSRDSKFRRLLGERPLLFIRDATPASVPKETESLLQGSM